MSGPKCSEYSVRESAEVRRRRELERRRERARAIAERLSDLEQQLIAKKKTFGAHFAADVTFPEADVGRLDADQLTVFVSAAQQAEAAARDVLQHGVAAAREAYLRDQLASDTLHGSTSNDRLADLAAELRESRTVVDDRREEFVATLARLDPSVPAAVVDELTSRLDRRVHGGQTTVDALLLDLRHRVDVANADARVAAATRAELDELELELAGRHGAEVDRARRTIEVARRDALVDDSVRRAVTSAVAADDARNEQEMVVEAASQVLDELGYSVDESFATLGAGSFTDVEKSDWGPYALRVRRVADSPQLSFRVVRTRPTSVGDQAAADRAAEERWCGDFDAFQRGMTREGVDSELVSARPPGMAEVPTVYESPVETVHETRRPVRRQRPREMGR